MADVMMPDGSNIRIPDFALDITAKEMLLELKKLNKEMDAELEKLVKATKEQIKQQAAQDKEASKDRDEQNKTLKKISENRTKFGDGATKALSNVASVAGKIGKGLGVLGAAAVGLTGALSKLTLGGFVRLGETLNEMTKSGVAFGDGVEHGGMGAIDAMSQLRLSGIDAAKVMMTYSNVVQSLGKRSFVEFNKSFMEATDSGALLGMSLDESADRLGRELANRQRMGALDATQRSEQLKQITTTLKRQQAYSTALGVSTEELAAFTEGLLSRTPALTASLNRLSSDLRSKVIAGITDFGTAMRALGGSEGGAIAEAFTEAAAMGGIGFSDSMTGYITAMPSLAGPANAYIKAVQSGTLTQDQANDMAQNLAKTMGNATQAERARIFSLARAGDAQAQSMANAITQFEQSKNKLAEINDTMGSKLTMDGVQEGTNRLQAIFRMLGGAVDAIKMQFLQGLGSVKSLTGAQGALKTAVDNIRQALSTTFTRLAGTNSLFDGVGDSAESLGAWFGRKLPKIIEMLSDKLVSFIIEIPKLIDQLKTFFKETIPKIKTQFENFMTAMSNAYTTVVAFKDGVVGFLKMLGLDITRKEQKKGADGKLVFEKDADGNDTDIPVMIEKLNWVNIGLAIGGAIVVKMLAGKLLGKLASTIAYSTGKAVGSLSKRFLPGRGTSASAGTGGAGVSTGAGGKGGAGSGLINMARGLKAIANPQALAGLAAITLAINGIAFALKIAAPAFEPFGKMILSIAQGVAPVLIAALRTIGDIVVSVVSTIPPLVSSMSEVIFSVLGGISELISSISGAIAGTITAVADGISSVISAIKGDQEAMMQLQTDQLNVVNQSIVDLSGIPSKNLFNTARGISSIAEAMKSFADTVMGREGGIIDSGLNLFRGAKTDGTDAFIDSINRFAAIDGERIAFNAQAIINANRAQAGLTDFASMPAAGAENADIAETVIDHSVQIVSSDVNEIASAGFGNITETVKQFLITLNTNILTLGDTLNSGINKAATLIPVISSTDNTVDLTEYNRQVEQLRPVIPNRELMFALGRSGVDISDYLNGLDQLNPVIPSTQTTVDLTEYNRQFDQLAPVITGNTDNNVDLTEYNRQFQDLTQQHLDEMPAIMTATESIRMRSQQAASLRTSSLSEQDGDITNTETRVNAAYVRSRMTSTSTIASRTQPNQVAAPVPAPMPVTDREAVASDPDNNLANQPTDPTEQIMPGMGNDVTEVMMAMLRAQQDTNRLLRQGNGTTRDLVRSL